MQITEQEAAASAAASRSAMAAAAAATAATYEDADQFQDPSSPSKKGDPMISNITLWQFLLELLENKQNGSLIAWTGVEREFKLLNAEEVARLWGLRKNKNNMNYDKLSRALRYYYDKNIIKKVLGQKFVYRFVSYPMDPSKSDCAAAGGASSSSNINNNSIIKPPSAAPSPYMVGIKMEAPSPGGGGAIQHPPISSYASFPSTASSTSTLTPSLPNLGSPYSSPNTSSYSAVPSPQPMMLLHPGQGGSPAPGGGGLSNAAAAAAAATSAAAAHGVSSSGAATATSQANASPLHSGSSYSSPSPHHHLTPPPPAHLHHMSQISQQLNLQIYSNYYHNLSTAFAVSQNPAAAVAVAAAVRNQQFPNHNSLGSQHLWQSDAAALRDSFRSNMGSASGRDESTYREAAAELAAAAAGSAGPPPVTKMEVSGGPRSRSNSPLSDDSQHSISAPLHLVSEEATRRRREDEEEERRREAEEERKKYHHYAMKRSRSRSPQSSRSSSPILDIKTSPPSSPEAVQQHDEDFSRRVVTSSCSTSSSSSQQSPSASSEASMSPSSSSCNNHNMSSSSSSNSKPSRHKSGSKPKPSPLSIENITAHSPVISPRLLSASSLNTPLVNLPSPPYSNGMHSKSPFISAIPPWPLSPFHLNLSPFATSPRNAPHHFTFPTTPMHSYSNFASQLISPRFGGMIPPPTFDFLLSPNDKSVPVLQ